MYTTLTNSLDQGLITAFMAIGVLITFELMGFPDMTVEGSYMLGGTLTAAALAAGHPPVVATLAGVAGGAVAGVCTAIIHTKMGINPIIAGLLTTSAAYSIALLIMSRPNVSLLGVQSLYDRAIAMLGLPATVWSRIGVTAVLLLVIAGLVYWFLNTDLGITIRAVGSNEGMIRALAVDTDKTKLIGMALANALVAVAGSLATQGQGFADVNMGVGSLVAAFASLVVGRAIIRSRRLSLWIVAVVVGSVIYRALLNLALRTGLPPDYFKLLTAVLVLVALYVPYVVGGWSDRRILRWRGPTAASRVTERVR